MLSEHGATAGDVNNLAEAISLHRKALETEPENTSYKTNLDWALRKHTEVANLAADQLPVKEGESA